MAMRIGGRSEAKRRLKVSGLVRSLPSSIVGVKPVEHLQTIRYCVWGVGLLISSSQNG